MQEEKGLVSASPHTPRKGLISMGSTQHSIHHDETTRASDIRIRTQQAEERRQMDAALITTGRIWEDHHRYTVSQWQSDGIDAHEEVFVVIDLTSDAEASHIFTKHIFPFQDGDACIHLDLEQAQAILHLARITATREQLWTLRHTTTIVGYAFKTRAEIAQRFPALFAPHEEEFEQRQPLSGRMGVTF